MPANSVEAGSRAVPAEFALAVLAAVLWVSRHSGEVKPVAGGRHVVWAPKAGHIAARVGLSRSPPASLEAGHVQGKLDALCESGHLAKSAVGGETLYRLTVRRPVLCRARRLARAHPERPVTAPLTRHLAGARYQCAARGCRRRACCGDGGRRAGTSGCPSGRRAAGRTCRAGGCCGASAVADVVAASGCSGGGALRF